MLIELKSVDLAFGADALLEGADLVIDKGVRMAVVGRNGSGKSSLLKLISGQLLPDEGEVRRQDSIRIGMVAQQMDQHIDGTALDYCLQVPDADATASQKLLERLGVEAAADFNSLSGGMKRRTELARAMSGQPDLLLLDEPTNHLDPETIEWLERWLKKPELSVVFISHDRRFIENVAEEILDLDRGRLYRYECTYSRFIERREKRLEDEARERERFNKRLSEEEIWIRKGIKARRTRNQGRARRLKAMREEKRQMRQSMGIASARTIASAPSGKIVIEAKNVGFSYGERRIIEDFSLTILRGDRLGIVGPNGTGKSTLINLLLGRLAPDTGTIRHGTKLEIAEFDQHRTALNDNLSALDNVTGGRESVLTANGERHGISYMQDFLFTPDAARGPIDRFSGGERARLMLAKLFSHPFNLLVMDEPTNDLDIETLELLEDTIADFTGTVLLVSHDRDFLDNITTSILHLDGSGRVEEYVGGFSEYQRVKTETTATKRRETASSTTREKTRSKKLSYNLQRELDALPGRIDALEQEISAIHDEMSGADFYRREAGEISALNQRLAEREAELETAFERWEELEAD